MVHKFPSFLFTLGLFLLLSFQASADHNGPDEVIYDGSAGQHEISLRKAVYRTEYRTEYYWTTCYGYRNGSYRSYPCRQSRTVSYEVLDHYVLANIEINFDPLLGHRAIKVKGRVNSQGYTSLEAYGNRDLFITANRYAHNTQWLRNGDLLVTAKYQVSFAFNKVTLNPIRHGIRDLMLVNDELSYVIGKVLDESTFRVHLLVKKTRARINRFLQPHEYQLEDVGADQTRVRINISELGPLKRSYIRRYTFFAQPRVDVPENLINEDELQPLQISQSIKRKY